MSEKFYINATLYIFLFIKLHELLLYLCYKTLDKKIILLYNKGIKAKRKFKKFIDLYKRIINN